MPNLSERRPAQSLVPLNESAFFTAVVSNSEDAIIAHSAEGIVLSWNRGAERTYGYSADEMIGRPIAVIVPEDKADELPSVYERILGGKEVGWMESARIAKDGRRIEISLTLLPVYNGEKSVVGFASIARDVTERNKAMADNCRRQRLLTDFVENGTECLHWVGPDGTILWANRAELEMLGYTPGEYVGHNIAEFHADEPVIRDMLNRLTAGEKLHGYEARMRAKDGSIRHLLINSSVYFEDGKFMHTRCFNRDITARREAQEALHEAQNQLGQHAAELERQVALRTAELERTVQSLEGMCYTMAHDLRTPLRSLQNYAHTLASDHAAQLDAEGWRYAERIQATAARMDDLIQDLLEFARVSHTGVPISQVDLNEQSLAWERLFADEAAARNAQLLIRRPLPPVLANRLLLDQVFSNLVGNALKFTVPGRRPIVEISGEVVGQFVHLWVRDNGIGIPPEQSERVFGLFERLHNPKEFPGTGVGLAIVRKAVERLGGNIKVESSIGEGSRFCLRLPSPVVAEETRPSSRL